MLLRLESIHVHRQLRRSDDVGKINELPARELRPITQIEVLAQSVILPAAALLDAGTTPKPSRPVEIEKPAAAATGDLLKQKMSIQKDRLHPCEQRIAAVQMPPPRLNHSDFWVGKEMDGAFEQVFFGNKIGVEDAKKFAFRSSKSHGEGASLESGAIRPMDPLDVETALAPFLRG